MYPIDLSGKTGIVFGIANHRSIAWAIAQILHEAGEETGTRSKERRRKVLEDLPTWRVDVLDNPHRGVQFLTAVLVEIREAQLFVEYSLGVGAEGKQVTDHRVAVAHQESTDQMLLGAIGKLAAQ